MTQAPIDLRSDTVTRPSVAMREAMARAEVGDDGYGEDPTVNALEKMSAALFKKEAAVFFPSGTMANQAALRALAPGGGSLFSDGSLHLVTTERASTQEISRLEILPLTELSSAITGPRIVATENSQNFLGGLVMPLKDVTATVACARLRGALTHLDGARIFNCQTATGIPVSAWAGGFDTVQFCLSKGLGAPAGALVVGSRDIVTRVRRERQLLGGRMRQPGILAAAGIYALEHNVGRLSDDHRRAQMLAAGLRDLGFLIQPWPETNIVHFNSSHATPETVAELMRAHGVLVSPKSDYVRAVTHLDVDDAAVEGTLVVAQKVDRGLQRQ